jgi:glycosyltransferase involved in cell wall biosynthesis
MAWGRAVVSTSVGAESIAYTQDKDIKIADNAQEFADAIIALLTNESLRKRMGENAQELIKSKYDNKLIAQKILDFAITNSNQ